MPEPIPTETALQAIEKVLLITLDLLRDYRHAFNQHRIGREANAELLTTVTDAAIDKLNGVITNLHSK